MLHEESGEIATAPRIGRKRRICMLAYWDSPTALPPMVNHATSLAAADVDVELVCLARSSENGEPELKVSGRDDVAHPAFADHALDPEFPGHDITGTHLAHEMRVCASCLLKSRRPTAFGFRGTYERSRTERLPLSDPTIHRYGVRDLHSSTAERRGEPAPTRSAS